MSYQTNLLLLVAFCSFSIGLEPVCINWPAWRQLKRERERERETKRKSACICQPPASVMLASVFDPGRNLDWQALNLSIHWLKDGLNSFSLYSMSNVFFRPKCTFTIIIIIFLLSFLFFFLSYFQLLELLFDSFIILNHNKPFYRMNSQLLLTCCWINFGPLVAATLLGCAVSPLQSNSFEHWSKSSTEPLLSMRVRERTRERERKEKRCVCAILESEKRRLDTWYLCLNEWVFLPAGV